MDIAWTALAQAWQVTLLIVVVLAIVRFVGRDRPHLAYVLWLVVLVKCVTPPIWASPLSLFSQIQSPWPATPATASQHLSKSNAPEGIRDSDGEWELPDAKVVWSTAPTQISEEQAEPSPWLARIAHWAICIWLGGVVFAAVRTIALWRRCSRRIRDSESAAENSLAKMLDELRTELGVRSPVRLVVSNNGVGPAVLGLWHPQLILPATLAQDVPRNLRAVMAHELIHIRRGDLWLALLQSVVKALWWFYPLVWWVDRLLTREVERCCDEEVIGELRCDPKDYARGLLEILERKHELRPAPALPGVKPVEVTTQRLERIMRLGQGCHRRTPKRYWALMLLLTMATIPGAAMVVADEDVVLKSPPPLRPHTPRAESGTNAAKLIQENLRCDQETALMYLDYAIQTKDGGIAKTLPKFAPPPKAGAWQPASVEIQIEILQVTSRSLQELDAGWRLAATTSIQHQSSKSLVKKPISRPLPDSDSKTEFSANITESRQVTPFFKSLNESQSGPFLKKLKTLPGAKVVSAPCLRVANGRPAVFANTVQRPFVVGMKPIAKDARHVQPKIQIVDEGLVVKLRPAIRDEHKIWLDFIVELSNIRDVQESSLQIKGLDHAFKIQAPNIVRSQVQSRVAIETGSTIVIGGLPSKDGNLMKHTLIAIKAHRVDAKTKHADPEDTTFSTRVYNVKELVMADREELLKALRLPIPEEVKSRKDTTVSIDNLGTLVEVIQRDIQPESWDDEGGEGQIQPFATNLSLVVSHTELIHEQIKKKLSRLRAKLNIAEPNSWGALKALRTPRAAQAQDAERHYYAKAYSVADLAIILPGESLAGASAKSKPKPNLDTLVDLITATVAPDSWDSPQASIQPYLTNLSLVVHNTTEVHDSVEDLLGQLRKLQSVQIASDVRRLPLALVKVVRREKHRRLEQGEPVVLSQKELKLLTSKNTVRRLMKITTFNGQRASCNVDGKKPLNLKFQAVASDSQKFVRFSYSLAGAEEDATAVTIPTEGAILTPLPRKLLKTTKTGDLVEREVLLIAPRILIEEPLVR